MEVGAISNFRIMTHSSETVRFYIGGSELASAVVSPADEWVQIFASYNGTTMTLVVNGSIVTKAQSGTVNLSGNTSLGNLAALTTNNLAEYAIFYMADEFIDFSDEATRLLFADALGFPVPLQPSIDAGLIPEGLVRMGFEDVGDLGLNSGTGGNFTVNGTVISGADVNV